MSAVLEETRGKLKPAPRRRFTLLDAMVMVGATAAGFVVTRMALAGFMDALDSVTNEPGRLVVMVEGGVAWYFALTPVSIAWAVALIALRLSPPRPALRRLWRQPGLTACLALAVGLVMLSLVLGAVVASNPQASVFGFDLILWIASMGWTVAAVWVVQALSGRWRPEPDWIDRMGRALGVLWIIGPTLGLCLILIARHWM